MTALHHANRGLIFIFFTMTLLIICSVGSSFAASCPCLGGVDNYCLYGPSYPDCAMTYPGGYCDPNGDGDFADADWVKGYYAYQETCPDGGPNPPPPIPGGGNDYSPWIYGIHWYGDHYASSDVEAMTGGKGIWVLETITIWDGWTVGDQLQKFQTIVDRGHTLILRIQPRWGWSIPGPGPERQQYLDAVEAAAQMVKDIGHIWQIGNEMNLYGEYGGGVLTAQEYIDYFKQIRQRIKNVNSSLGPQIVLVGPVSPGAYAGEVRHTDGLQYLGQMSALLNANDFDGFALHAYGAPWLDANGARWDFQNGSGGYAAQLGVIDAHGFHEKPAFILEFNRQTLNQDAGQEAQTAQFIIGAYQDLQAWNNDPNHHPIIGAIWFIYADVGGWEIFSLRKLRDHNPRGVNQDVWDSFRYACSLDIPAGDMVSGPGPPPPPPLEDLAALHMADTLPNSLETGQTVQLTLTMKNTGANTWQASSNDRLGAGGDNAFGWSGFVDGGYSNSVTDQRVFLAGSDAIITQNTKTFTLSITAPAVAGEYQFSARMVRDGVAWFGDSITKTIMVNSGGGDSLTGGQPKGAFGSGGQTDDVTDPETWRWSEWFYGFQGIDRIAWAADACGENHNYAVGWHQNDLIEYRMKFGGEFSRLIVRGMADRPGPVGLEIYIDGQLSATAAWDNNNNCNQDTAVDIDNIAYGTHAVALKFVNDYYEPGSGLDRNFLLDGLKVVRSSAPSPNNKPVALFTASPTGGQAPLAISFDASSSSDPDGDTLSFSWDFADGSQASGHIVEHTFEAAGEYTVTLTVTDGHGGSDTASKVVSVSDGSGGLPPYCPDTLDFASIRSQLNQQGQDLAFVKIGFHVGVGGNQDGLGEWMTCLDAAGVPFFLKSVDSAGQIWEAAQLKAASGVPHVLLYRKSVGDGWNPDVPDYNRSPYDAAVQHWQRHRDAFPPELEQYKHLIWVETINEIDKNRAEWLGEFAYHTAQMAMADGFNWAAFGWSSGEPEREHWEGPWMRQFLELAGGNPDRIAVALHEYSYVRDNLDRLYPYLVGRFQMLFDVCDSYNIPRPNVVITEFGWEYQNIAGADQAMNVDLPWAAELYADFPQVLGAAIWYLGGGWAGIANQAQKLIAPLTEYTLQKYFVVPLESTPPPTGKSKLSIHTGFLGPESMRFIEQARPTVVKILDELKVAQEVKQKSPHTLIVGRIWYDAWQRLGEGTPEDRAQEWWQDVRETILAYPDVDYWEGYNEPAIHDAERMSWYARFEQKRVEILASHGRKACIGNFSTGMPPVERDVWEAFYPAIDTANRHGGVLGLHEYSAPDMDWLFDYTDGEGWLTGRYRKVYRQFLIPDGREIPLIITECGIDGGVMGEPGKGWRSYQNPESYVDQLEWYDSLLRQDSYVLGATIFSLEIPNWWDFDIGGPVSELIGDYVQSSGE